MITGGCRCGQVRYTVSAPPTMARMCWCRDCQYFAAGSPTINVAFPAEAVSITGTLTAFRSTANSGNAMTRKFCPHCGTPVTTAADIRPHIMLLRAGTLDDPNLIKPERQIWTASAPKWACIDPSIPAVEGQPT